jgi:hypothetical protein
MTNEAPQHDDHCWIVIGGEAWCIHYIEAPIIILWRGYAPFIEYNMLDISDMNMEQYCMIANQILMSSDL